MSDAKVTKSPYTKVLSLGINVNDTRKLPQVGRQLSQFLKSIDHDHGPFDIHLAVSVEPTMAAAIGPIEYPQKDDEPQMIEVVLLGEDFDGSPEGAD